MPCTEAYKRHIRYLYDLSMGIELIFCENSTISYPTHNHVSVFTIGIVLDGAIVFTADNNAKTYEKNQTFVICPYMPHSISAYSRYTLLSLCIDKNITAYYTANEIRSEIMALLMSTPYTEKVNPYQILQLLNCLNLDTAFDLFSASPDCHSDSRNPFIHNLKRQLVYCTVHIQANLLA